MRQSSRLSGLLILALAAAACQDAADPISPAPEISASVGGGQGSSQAPDLETLDRAVPGFGGFFLDASGAPTVYLTDVRGRGRAEQALDAYLRARGLDGAALQVVQAQFSYRQLQQWFDRSSVEVFDVPGMVYADMQEATNRLEFGVEHPVAGAAVLGITRRLGIPDGAVTAVQREPVIQVATLRDAFRPLIGGTQINFPGFLCTMGFNATAAGQASYITNSHCTSTQGGVESTPYWQPLQSSHPTQVAVEVADPAYQRNIAGCPRGRKCRRSDASRASYINGITGSLGVIAKTTGANNGSLTQNGTFSIIGEHASDVFTVGTTLNKIGRTTGWTQGQVTNSCVTTGVSGTNIAQICQTFVGAGVGAGDSGSPVFSGNSSVTLAGILWGGSGSNLYVFSPLKNIETELGALTTY